MHAALEEILANAVYHRSYQVNEPITVRITPDAIEVTSFPGFDRSITDDAIDRFDIRARIYRNRRIGDFLKELKLIEGRNTGFPNARKALEANGSPPLQFEMNPERDYLSVTIPVHTYFSQKNEKSEKKIAFEKQVLSCLSSPLTLTELAHTMGYKSISAKLRVTVAELERAGQIHPVAVGNAVKYTV